MSSGSYYPNPYVIQAEAMQNSPNQGSTQYMQRVSPELAYQQQVMAQQAAYQNTMHTPLAQTPQVNLQSLVQQATQQEIAALQGQIQQAIQQGVASQMGNLQAQISYLQSQQRSSGGPVSLQLPYQDLAGVREYPDLTPFPVPQTTEMFSGALQNQTYGVDNSTVIATFQTQSAVPFYVVAFRFGLFKSVNENMGTGIIGAWLPLSAKRLVDFNTGNISYEGRDFTFNIESSGKNLIWQSGDIPSEQADGDERWGYVLPCEVKVMQGEVIIISATPIGNVVAGAEWRLFVTMYGYKMINNEDLVTLASAKRIEEAAHLTHVQSTAPQSIPRPVQIGNLPTVYTAQ